MLALSVLMAAISWSVLWTLGSLLVRLLRWLL